MIFIGELPPPAHPILRVCGQVWCSRQHLHAIIVGVSHDDVPIVADGNVKWMLELPYAAAIAADAAYVSPVPVPQHLHTMIETISYNKLTKLIKQHKKLEPAKQ